MKKIIVCLLIVSSCANVKTVYGTYKHDDVTLELKPDNTYLYEYPTHLMGKRWAYGEWKSKRDTLYFTPIAVYDTVRLKNKDSLILSENKTPDLIQLKQQTDYTNILYQVFTQVGIFRQDVKNLFYKNKLVRKNNKLYSIDEAGKPSRYFFTK